MIKVMTLLIAGKTPRLEWTGRSVRLLEENPWKS
jgi:hypothetical protein